MSQVSGHRVVAVQAPDRLGRISAQEVIATEKQYILQTYSRPDVVFVRGQGTKMYDADGKEYLDFAAGIAVNALGTCPTAPIRKRKVRFSSMNLWRSHTVYSSIELQAMEIHDGWRQSQSKLVG